MTIKLHTYLIIINNFSFILENVGHIRSDERSGMDIYEIYAPDGKTLITTHCFAHDQIIALLDISSESRLKICGSDKEYMKTLANSLGTKQDSEELLTQVEDQLLRKFEW